MDTIWHARFYRNQVAKILQIQADTGLTVSQLFRRLIDVAEVKPIETTVILSTNCNSDAIHQDAVAVAA